MSPWFKTAMGSFKGAPGTGSTSVACSDAIFFLADKEFSRYFKTGFGVVKSGENYYSTRFLDGIAKNITK